MSAGLGTIGNRIWQTESSLGAVSRLDRGDRKEWHSQRGAVEARGGIGGSVERVYRETCKSKARRDRGFLTDGTSIKLCPFLCLPPNPTTIFDSKTRKLTNAVMSYQGDLPGDLLLFRTTDCTPAFRLSARFAGYRQLLVPTVLRWFHAVLTPLPFQTLAERQHT